MENDYYLHNFHVQNGSLLTMKRYREPWNDDSDDDLDAYADAGDEDIPLDAFVPPKVLQNLLAHSRERERESQNSQSSQGGAGGSGGALTLSSSSENLSLYDKSGREGFDGVGSEGGGLGKGDDAVSSLGALGVMSVGLSPGHAGRMGRGSLGLSSGLSLDDDDWGPAALEKLKMRNMDMKRRKRRVRHRCTMQRSHSALWWIEAIQRYEQHRMWMQLGPPKQGRIMQRFERIHQPYKLTQFDKLFGYEFMVPIPLAQDSASAQGAGGLTTSALRPGGGSMSSMGKMDRGTGVGSSRDGGEPILGPLDEDKEEDGQVQAHRRIIALPACLCQLTYFSSP